MSTNKPPEDIPEWLFQEDLSKVPDPISHVLAEYSGIPKEDQKQHILEVRNRAYKAHRYPCLGRFRFLELDLSTHPLYEEYVLPRLKENGGKQEPIFLDVGTCLGQDIRKLIFDGVQPSRLYGSDIVAEFIDAGYELFRDEDKFPRSHFLCPGNVFDKSESDKLYTMDGKVDILQISAVFHLFSDAEQSAVAERCLRLLRKETGSRCLILGAQVGNVNGGEIVRPNGLKRSRHNADTWNSLWQKVCKNEEFRDKVKRLEVKTNMIGRSLDNLDSEQQRKHIGTVEEGFRWLVWHVWVEF